MYMYDKNVLFSKNIILMAKHILECTKLHHYQARRIPKRYPLTQNYTAPSFMFKQEFTPLLMLNVHESTVIN